MRKRAGRVKWEGKGSKMDVLVGQLSEARSTSCGEERGGESGGESGEREMA